MTPEELQQITAIIQAAVAPITTRLDKVDSRLDTLEKGQTNLETKLATVETTLRSEIKASEQKIIGRVDQLEKLTADYLDGRVQTVTRRVDHIERHLNLT
jgi:DNA anti-recombination protein RmuC